MKKKIGVILFLVVVFTLVGCGEQEDGPFVNLHYMNQDGNALLQEKYFLLEENNSEMAAMEVIEELQNPQNIKDFQPAIPQDIRVKDVQLKGERLEISFSEEYKKLGKGTEVLVRAAVVQTLVQLPNVKCVSFYVEGEPLADSNGNLVGAMGAEDFAQNIGASLKTYQEKDIKLYFSNKDGTKLKEEKRTGVHYNNNTSIEKLVVEQLMKGTSSDKRSETIPNTVKLIGVSVKDGVCYVNFNSAFLDDGYNQKPEIAIYSIVNSIIANGNVTRVQILIDGSKEANFKGTLDLSEPFEWKNDLIEE